MTKNVIENELLFEMKGGKKHTQQNVNRSQKASNRPNMTSAKKSIKPKK